MSGDAKPECEETAKVIVDAVMSKAREYGFFDGLTSIAEKHLWDYYYKTVLEKAVDESPKDPSRQAVMLLPKVFEELKKLKSEGANSGGLAVYFYARMNGLDQNKLKEMLAPENIPKININSTSTKDVLTMNQAEVIEALLSLDLEANDLQKFLMTVDIVSERGSLKEVERIESVGAVYKEVV
ncbi:MAG: hypothetical protein QW035_03945 [Candidatus Anstonellales archaeon]